MDRPPLTPTEFASAVTAITSAFGDPTRRDIFVFAHEGDQGVTAAETAKQFDLHPNVARHHLDKLAGGGYLDVAVESRSSGAGRPSKRYRPSGPHFELEIGVRQNDILVSLLGKAISMLTPEQAETMAEEVGIEYGRAMAGSVNEASTSSFRSALHTVADALTANGFAAHAEQTDDGLRIVSENCPFGGTAIEHPVICAVDKGMVRGMLESLYGSTSTETETSVAFGDATCVTTVDA